MQYLSTDGLLYLNLTKGNIKDLRPVESSEDVINVDFSVAPEYLIDVVSGHSVVTILKLKLNLFVDSTQ